MSNLTKALHRPEILAPAGDEECLRTAVGAGADAVYFGLSAGFNARAKATSFTPEDLPRVFEFLHERGVKGYVTFNTLIYDAELKVAERLLSAIARAGADAIIVQDLGVARLAHALAPELPIHASTQMTVSSAEAAEVAKSLGVVRVVLPRELSIDEIRRFKQRTSLELECFVHGALCVSWSGQCLTSEVWGQRSANRGQCAQSCRLPYDLIVDGAITQTGLEKYLLSPKDLGAWDLLPDLVDAGVSCFKIEGRYKGPDYVAATVEKYRKVLDAYLRRGERLTLGREDTDELAFTHSRGFTPGWLRGDDHQELSHGLYPRHRGLKVGTIERIGAYRVYVKLLEGAPIVKVGDWMLFEPSTSLRPGQGNEEEGLQGGTFAVEAPKAGVQEMRFGEPGPDLAKLKPGDGVWKSHDSSLKRRLLRYIDAERRVALDFAVRGRMGEPLEVLARDRFGRSAMATSEQKLEAARGAPLGEAVLREKLGSLGDTRYEVGNFVVDLEGSLALSPSELKRVRRRVVEALEAQPIPRITHAVRDGALGEVAKRSGARETPDNPATVEVIPLCRTIEQVQAVLGAGAREVFVDFMELTGLGAAVRTCREKGARVVVATPRVQKPGEEPIDRRLEALKPDGILARHLGALERYKGERGDFTLHGDFSLNATNAITAGVLLDMGLATLTPSYDLNIAQLEEMIGALPADRIEVTAHQHLPLYHTEYCLYAHHLSEGKDYRDCGRPCEEHRVSLKDPKGLENPVLVDIGCRNTVFDARAQSAAPHVSRLRAKGVRRFRVEFVWETGDEAARVFAAYRGLVEGKKFARDLLKEIGALERYGVTSGTLAVIA